MAVTTCKKCGVTKIDGLKVCWDCWGGSYSNTCKCGLHISELMDPDACEHEPERVNPIPIPKKGSLTKDQYRDLEYSISPVDEYKEKIDEALDSRDKEKFLKYSSLLKQYLYERGTVCQ